MGDYRDLLEEINAEYTAINQKEEQKRLARTSFEEAQLELHRYCEEYKFPRVAFEHLKLDSLKLLATLDHTMDAMAIRLEHYVYRDQPKKLWDECFYPTTWWDAFKIAYRGRWWLRCFWWLRPPNMTCKFLEVTVSRVFPDVPTLPGVRYKSFAVVDGVVVATEDQAGEVPLVKEARSRRHKTAQDALRHRRRIK